METRTVMQRPITYWSWLFLGLALIAGIMGLSGFAGTATALSYVVFLLFFVAYLVSVFVGRKRRRANKRTVPRIVLHVG